MLKISIPKSTQKFRGVGGGGVGSENQVCKYLFLFYIDYSITVIETSFL